MEKFSWKKRFGSFRFAAAGLKQSFRTEHNLWIHLGASALVVLLSILLNTDLTEKALLVFAIGLVWMAELFNTCIEKIMDFISVERKPQIKLIKDISAAAVLVAALTAALIGCLVFIPKIF